MSLSLMSFFLSQGQHASVYGGTWVVPGWDAMPWLGSVDGGLYSFELPRLSGTVSEGEWAVEQRKRKPGSSCPVCGSPYLMLTDAGERARGRFLSSMPLTSSYTLLLGSPVEKVPQWATRARNSLRCLRVQGLPSTLPKGSLVSRTAGLVA